MFNRIENLRLLCLNCHSQTSTFAGSKTRKHFEEKKCLSLGCDAEIRRTSTHCQPCHSIYRKYKKNPIDVVSIIDQLDKGISLSMLATELYSQDIVLAHLYFLGSQHGKRYNGLKGLLIEGWQPPKSKGGAVWGNKKLLEDAIEKNNSLDGTLISLDINKHHRSLRHLRNAIIYHDITLPTNWKATYAMPLFQKGPPIEEYLVKDGKVISSGHLKTRLWKEGILEQKCSTENCGLTVEWLGKPLMLHLDHVNGDRHDNRIENLRILCPNCHSQTHTFVGRKNKQVKAPVIALPHVVEVKPPQVADTQPPKVAVMTKTLSPSSGQSPRQARPNPNQGATRYDKKIVRAKAEVVLKECRENDCTNEVKRKGSQCAICKKQPREKLIKCSGIKCTRTAEAEKQFCKECNDSKGWPSNETIISLVEKTSWMTTGKLLGVSDNAVRKHLKAAGIDLSVICRDANRRADPIKYRNGERRLCAAPQCKDLPETRKHIYCKQCTPIFTQQNIPSAETVNWLIRLWDIEAVSKALGTQTADLHYFLSRS